MSDLIARRCRFWQGIAGLVVVAAGWIPCFSWTNAFWEFQLSQFGNASPRIHEISARSPAERAGLRVGDRIRRPDTIAGIQAALRQLQADETLDFQIEREGAAVPLKLVGVTPALAAVWYASAWFPVAGLIGAALGLFLVATAPLRPTPYWRSAVVGATGMVLASGFVVARCVENSFTRVRVFQQWLMGTGAEWTWGQTWWGLAAAVSLVLLATWEVRLRLASAAKEVG